MATQQSYICLQHVGLADLCNLHASVAWSLIVSSVLMRRMLLQELQNQNLVNGAVLFSLEDSVNDGGFDNESGSPVSVENAVEQALKQGAFPAVAGGRRLLQV